jgi:hypothetical protein
MIYVKIAVESQTERIQPYRSDRRRFDKGAEDCEISAVLAAAATRHHGARHPAAGFSEPDYPGRPGAQLLRGDHAVGHHSVGCRSAHLQGFGGNR